MNPTDTIAALSTPPGEGGIAVVRVSGEGTLVVVSSLFREGEQMRTTWEHRRLYHGHIVDKTGEIIDEVMAAVMRAPESYTGEDTVEVSCHGGRAIVSRLLSALFASGARPAEAGEFTRRAFLNGKMDLIQAEAVADLIHARSELQRAAAQRQLAGSLSERIDALADEMLGLLGIVEANIDFIDEDIDTLDTTAALALVARQREALDDLLAGAAFAHALREGCDVAIAGPVNAGKSSLFNRLAGEERAIVTEIAGTTRDVIREAIAIDGVLFMLHDTAGLREDTGDRVESIGVVRAVDTVANADVVVAVIDASEAIPAPVQDWLGTLDTESAILATNKSDLLPHASAANIEAPLDRVSVSAATGDGIVDLRRLLFEKAGGADIVRLARERAVLNARVRELLADAHDKLDNLERLLGASRELEVLAVEVRDVLACYESATGRRYEDGLLDTIFSRFCIGK